MAKVLLVNPHRRRARRTPAQKRATEKMIRARWKGHHSSHKRRHNPHRRAGHRTAAQKRATRKMIAARRSMSNPHRRSRHEHHHYPKHRRSPHRRRHYRRNPIARGFSLNNVLNNQLKPSAIMAGGGLLLDIVMGYVNPHLPSMLTGSNTMKTATKGVFAIGLSAVVGSVADKGIANDIALGCLTITIHDALKELISTMAPSIPLDGVGYMSPASQVGYYMHTGAPEAPALPAAPGNAPLGYYMQVGDGDADNDFDSSMSY